MDKVYLFVSPSEFSRYGEINIDGEFEHVGCEDFNVSNPKENYLIFELGYAEYNDGKQFDTFCRELVTREKFKFEVTDNTNGRSGKKLPVIVLSSEKLGLYSNALVLKEIIGEPSRVSGLLCHFNENSDDKLNYCSNLKNMIEIAQSYKENYDSLVKGPDRFLRKQMKKAYKNVK